MGFPRILVVLAAVPGLLLSCSSAAKQPAGPSPSPTMAATVAPAPAAEPAVPACGDGPALLASMTTRDKLAQLLMVGVTGAADARAVVDSHHVGGIFIGSWTDMSMLSDGSL
ncbi:MAG: glycoside hydrolase family 3 protein, partial [Mycobacterium sp.]|nr:glycoside hydrolase family 3 protein [Mycobacterium sp.]